jgi:hypothetical protein
MVLLYLGSDQIGGQLGKGSLVEIRHGISTKVDLLAFGVHR